MTEFRRRQNSDRWHWSKDCSNYLQNRTSSSVTHIGNAPNFMVRSIAEEAGTPMPSFFGYMLKYSIVYLIPVFVAVTLIFF